MHITICLRALLIPSLWWVLTALVSTTACGTERDHGGRPDGRSAFGADALQRGLAPPDVEILQDAFSTLVLQIEMAQLAPERSACGAVRDFAAALLQGSRDGEADIAALAHRRHTMLSPMVGSEALKRVRQLSGRHGAAFDRTYLADQRARWEQAAQQAVQAEGQAKDPEVLKFARQSSAAIAQLLARIGRVAVAQQGCDPR